LASDDLHVPYGKKNCYALRRLFPQQILTSRGFDIFLPVTKSNFTAGAELDHRNTIVSLLVRKGFDVSIGQVWVEAEEDVLIDPNAPAKAPETKGIRVWTQIDFSRQSSAARDEAALQQLRRLSVDVSELTDAKGHFKAGGGMSTSVFGTWPSGILIGNISTYEICPEQGTGCVRRLRVTDDGRDRLEGGTFYSLHDPFSKQGEELYGRCSFVSRVGAPAVMGDAGAGKGAPTSPADTAGQVPLPGLNHTLLFQLPPRRRHHHRFLRHRR